MTDEIIILAESKLLELEQLNDIDLNIKTFDISPENQIIIQEDEMNQMICALNNSINNFDRSKLSVALPEKIQKQDDHNANVENSELQKCNSQESSLSPAVELNIKMNNTKLNDIFDLESQLSTQDQVPYQEKPETMNSIVRNYKQDIISLKQQLSEYKNKQLLYQQNVIQNTIAHKQENSLQQQSMESFIPSSFLLTIPKQKLSDTFNSIHFKVAEQSELNQDPTDLDDPQSSIMKSKTLLINNKLDYHQQNIEKAQHTLSLFALDSPRQSNKPFFSKLENLQSQINKIPPKQRDQQQFIENMKEQSTQLKNLIRSQDKPIKQKINNFSNSTIQSIDINNSQQQPSPQQVLVSQQSEELIYEQVYTQQTLKQPEVYNVYQQSTFNICNDVSSEQDDYIQVASPVQDKKLQQLKPQLQNPQQYIPRKQNYYITESVTEPQSTSQDSLILQNSDIDKELIRSKITNSQYLKSQMFDEDQQDFDDSVKDYEIQIDDLNLRNEIDHNVISQRKLSLKIASKQHQMQKLEDRVMNLQKIDIVDKSKARHPQNY